MQKKVFSIAGADSQAAYQFVKQIHIPITRRVDVFGVGNEPQSFVTVHEMADQRALDARQITADHSYQLVVVKLYFQRHSGVQDRDTAATVIEQQVFKLVQNALEYREVDMFAKQINVTAVVSMVTGFENDIDHLPERIEQIDKQIEDNIP